MSAFAGEADLDDGVARLIVADTDDLSPVFRRESPQCGVFGGGADRVGAGAPGGADDGSLRAPWSGAGERVTRPGTIGPPSSPAGVWAMTTPQTKQCTKTTSIVSDAPPSSTGGTGRTR